MFRYGSLPAPCGAARHRRRAFRRATPSWLRPTGVPFAQWPAASRDPPSHHDRGDGIPSVLALIGAWDAIPGFRGQNKGACAVAVGSLAVSLGSQRPFPSSPVFGGVDILGPNHAMEEKEVLDGRCLLALGPRSRSVVRQRPGFRLLRGTRPQRRGIQRGRQTVQTEILVTGDYLRAQPVRKDFRHRPSLQGSFLCRSDRLRSRGIAETECMILPVRELAAFPRCSVCEQLIAGERISARWSLPVPAHLDDSRWQSEQTALFWAHRQYLRLGARPLEVGFGRGWRMLPSSSGTVPSDSGTILATASSSRACPRSLPVRSSLLHSRKFRSPKPIVSPSGRSHTPSVSSACSRPLSTTDGSPLTCRPRLRGAKHQWTHNQSDTHPSPRCAHSIRARNMLAQSSAAASKEQ